MITVAFLAFPLVAVVLFRLLRLPVAIATTAVAGYLPLPTQGGWDFPGIQAIDKNSMPAIMALVLAIVHGRNAPGVRPGWLPGSPLILSLIALLIVGRVGTFLTNGDPQVFGPTVLPPLTAYDTLSRIQVVLYMLVPFVLARKFLATPEAHRDLLVVIAVAGLCYSLPALYEVRMSPQLNNMIYGYFPHDWIQHIRRDGFRPVVFLNHGLMLGIFFACTVLAAASLSRVGESRQRTLWIAALVWLVITLYLAKSLGAFATALMLLPVILLTPPRMQVLVAGIIGVLIVTYPLLRGAGWVPIDMIMNWAQSISEDRAGSLSVRLYNEENLLARANERPIFGWGAWGRSFIFDESGRATSITDGYWAIVIGIGGWVQYFGEFGMLCFAPLVLALRRKSYDISPATAGLSLVLAVNLIDLIPNSGISVVTWLMAGALAGRLELSRASDPAAEATRSAEVAPSQVQPVGLALARSFPADGLRYRREFHPAGTEGGPAKSPASDLGPERPRGPAYARNLGAAASKRGSAT